VAIGMGGGDSFEDWIVDHFGRRLFELFFKSYTEKVWGVACRDISSDWAAQRIKGLSLGRAITNALRGGRGNTIKTLVDEFRFPRLGAGQAWEKMAAAVAGAGGVVMLRSPATALFHANGRVSSMSIDREGMRTDSAGDYFLVSAPLTDIVAMMQPQAPDEVVAAARSLRYRNHISVNLVLRGNPFPDNWIYVHDDSVGFARIANYRNFSAEMAASDDVSPITVEYFSFPGDEFDRASDEAMMARATRELAKAGLVKPEMVLSGFVVRSAKAYPVIERGHDRHVATIRNWLGTFGNLLPIGRSGMFKYNNQDHAMMTGLLAARTALGLGNFDPWAVNIDAEYHEEGPARPS
jgi:protoporphyrinogen oxidase